MAKTIQYPTQEWLDNWIDKYLDKHPDEKIEDFDLLKEQAEGEWWDKQIDKGNPTPFDLNEEEKQAQKAAMKGMAKAVKKPANYSLEGKPKRERKPNEEKRDLMASLLKWAQENAENAEMPNIEREITFNVGENHYSVTLTCHRKPKT